MNPWRNTGTGLPRARRPRRDQEGGWGDPTSAEAEPAATQAGRRVSSKGDELLQAE